MFKVVQYLKFLGQATNQHGVHSPFVYSFVTKCLYANKNNEAYKTLKKNKPKNQSLKQAKLLFKALNYFKSEVVLISNNVSKFNQQAIALSQANQLKHKINTNEFYDAIVLNFKTEDNAFNIKNAEWLNHVKNDSVLIINNIYTSKESIMLWETLKLHPKVQVTVDCFCIAFVFFRKEQAKQHFKIRV